MKIPPLPTSPADTWECQFLFESARDVRAVSSRGGLVLAGGDELYMSRPGAQGMASRPRPPDVGVVVGAAPEPRAPFRYAFATEELVALFIKNDQGEQIVRLRPTDSGAAPTHLAWGRAEGRSVLYVRWSDGGVMRTTPDLVGVEVIELPPMDAIASDDNGVLALVSFAQPEPLAYVTRDGEHLETRPLGAAVEPSGHVFLAVADTAVAYAIEGTGAFVSRKAGEPFVRSEPHGAAGPVDFQGVSSDAALLGANRLAAFLAIIRVTPDGAAVRIADFGSDDMPPPEMTGLSWDASRHAVWGASPQMGLVRCTAPSAKRGKKALS
jgi:hypothetical protein